MPAPGQISIHGNKCLLVWGTLFGARNHIGDEPFAVLLADDLILAGPGCLEQGSMHIRVGGNVVAVEDATRKHSTIWHFGRCNG